MVVLAASTVVLVMAALLAMEPYNNTGRWEQRLWEGAIDLRKRWVAL